MRTEPDDLLALAEGLAERASDLLLAGLADGVLRIDTKSTDTDMVTEVDRSAEALIVDGLRRSRPHDGIVGEEGASVEGTSGVVWTIDPIDGTTNFVYGYPGFSVSIGASIDGEPSVGVVAVPLHLEVFSAVRGGGAHRNGEVVRCSDETELGRALVATGFGYDPQRRVRQAEVVTRVISRIRDIRRGGAASVDFCSVASGRVDAYFERGMQRWDWAAGALIAQEAGAIVAELDGGPLDDGCILAAPAGLWQPLADLLLEAGADEV